MGRAVDQEEARMEAAAVAAWTLPTILHPKNLQVMAAVPASNSAFDSCVLLAMAWQSHFRQSH